jgi:hypothetical protein
MKLKMKVTSVMKVNDQKILVNLAGKHGHIALDLPIDHGQHIYIGAEFTLEYNVGSLGFIGEIDEVADDDDKKVTTTTLPLGGRTITLPDSPEPPESKLLESSPRKIWEKLF